MRYTLWTLLLLLAEIAVALALAREAMVGRESLAACLIALVSGGLAIAAFRLVRPPADPAIHRP